MMMAAGLGTRLRPFTDTTPKPLLPLMGVPMAQFPVDALRAAGVTRMLANIHHLPELSRIGLSSLELGGIRLDFSDESAELLGSAGGLRQASVILGDTPFFLMNADVLCEVDLKSLLAAHRRLRSQWGVAMTLTLFRAGPPGGRYREIFLDRADREHGLVSGFGDLQEGRPFFAGAAIIEPEALASVPPSGPAEFVPTILEPLVRARKAGFHLTSGHWHDIGSPELWIDAHVAMLRGLENGRLPALWRRRIEAGNRRVAGEVWASREARIPGDRVNWVSPAYVGADAKRVPSKLGPRAILYGDSGGVPALSGGIGFSGKWVSLSSARP